MNFHVLSQRAGMRVALVTPAHLAHIRLVARVHVRMFLAVAAVGETPLAALELTSERFLAWRRERRDVSRMRAASQSQDCTPLPSFFCFQQKTYKRFFRNYFPLCFKSETLPPPREEMKPSPTECHPSSSLSWV